MATSILDLRALYSYTVGDENTNKLYINWGIVEIITF